jgi:RNA polymerase sigma-70 factor (ECF subfamily)
MSDELDRLYERLLVLRCQTGDELAFAELVARYQPGLRRFLRKMLDGDNHAAEDALQDAWFDVFRSVGKLNDLAAFRAWLFRIARDRAYRILRKRGVKLQPIDSIDLLDASADDALDEDDRRLLQASLDRLPHEQREVLMLRFVEEMNYQQIAAAVGCELGTVRSRLHYAKQSLRDQMEKETRP